MLYTAIDAPSLPRAEPVPGVLQYRYNNGGLNNQRMTLVGLMLAALRDGMPVRLPYIHLKDHRSTAEHVTHIGNIFHLHRIDRFAAATGLRILDRSATGGGQGWPYFEEFGRFTWNIASAAALRTLLDALAALRARLADNPEVLRLKTRLFADLGIDTVVQLRIESDWQAHFEAAIRPHFGDRGDKNASFARIITKVRNTFPDLRALVVTADEDAMPASKDAIRLHCRNAFQLELFWKADFLSASFLNELTPFDRSVIDFELALAGPRFVGTSLSTFANMAALHKLALARTPTRNHYIYNTDTETVLERQDNGLIPPETGPLRPNASSALLDAAT